MEGTLNYIGERSGECVNLIDRVAKKSLCQLKATLHLQERSEIDVVPENSQKDSTNDIDQHNKESNKNDINENKDSKPKDQSSITSSNT